jgi:hypothetical protein
MLLLTGILPSVLNRINTFIFEIEILRGYLIKKPTNPVST